MKFQKANMLRMNFLIVTYRDSSKSLRAPEASTSLFRCLLDIWDVRIDRLEQRDSKRISKDIFFIRCNKNILLFIIEGSRWHLSLHMVKTAMAPQENQWKLTYVLQKA